VNKQQQARVEEIFLAAIEVPPDERAAYLDRSCAADPDLRCEVDSLLENHEDDAERFLNPAEIRGLTVGSGPARSLMDDPPLTTGTKVGVYTIRGVLGSGGMGIVYIAEQERPRRTVALKIIRNGIGTAGVVRRFEHEAEMLGRLGHPGIANIFEAGAAEVNGVRHPFIAMEYIQGRMLTEHADVQRLDTRARLDLVARTCDAVHHAHQRGIIHRDLKPANILVDEVGQPKVLDFGVARLAHRALTGMHVTTLHTGVGQLIGTLPYMSPEHVGGDPREVDIRTDVYALGVVLYQLLTGRLPHDVTGRSIPDAARMIRDDEPARISSISRELRGDVDVIVTTALAKDRSRRYQSARELGDDIRRFAAGEPIAARRDSAFYVLRKQIRQYRTLAVAAAVAFVGLVGFLAYAGVQLRTEQRLTAVAVRQARELRDGLYAQNIAFAQASYLGNDVARMRRVLEDCPADLRGWEWRYLSKLANGDAASFEAEVRAWGGASLCPATGVIATRSVNTGFVKVWSLAAQRRAAEPRIFRTAGRVLDGVLAPGGDLLLCIDVPKTAILYRLRDGAAVWRADLRSTPTSPAVFSPDGSLVALGAGPSAIHILDAVDGKLVRTLVVPGPEGGPPANVEIVAFSGDGRALFAGRLKSDLVRLSTRGDEPPTFWRTEDTAQMAIAVDPRGARLAVPSLDGTVRVYNAATGQRTETIRSHGNKVAAAAFSPDGKFLASGGTEGVVHIHDPATGVLVQRLYGHSDRLLSIQFFADGRLMTFAREGIVRVWDSIGQPELPAIRAGERVSTAAVDPAGGTVALTDNRGVVRLVSLPGGEDVQSFSLKPSAQVAVMAFSADGTWIAAPGGDEIVVYDLAKKQIVQRCVGHVGGINRVAIAPDQRRIASTGTDGTVRLWDRGTGACFAVLDAAVDGLAVPQVGIAWSPSGDALLTSDQAAPFRVNLWKITEGGGTLERSWTGHEAGVFNVAWSFAREEVLSADDLGVVCAWPLKGDGPPRRLLGHTGAVYSMAVSSDGWRLLTGGFDNAVRLWDLRTDTELLTLRGHQWAVGTVAFASGGDRIVTVAGQDGIRVWDAPGRD